MMQVLVFHTAFLGDALLGVPLLKYFQQSGHEVHLVVRRGLGPLFEKMLWQNRPLLHQVYEVEKGNSKSYQKLTQTLGSYDIYINLHPSIRSLLFSIQVKSKKKYGFSAFGSQFVYTDEQKKEKSLPEALRYLNLTSFFDAEMKSKITKLQGAGMSMPVPSWAEAQVQWPRWDTSHSSSQINSIYEAVKPRSLGLFPGSVWPTKKYPYFAKIAQLAQKVGYQVYIFGSQHELKDAEEIQALVPDSINLAGKLSLLESQQFLAKMGAVISNDSGGQHMAAAAGVPVFTIFGPTVLDFGFRPWSNKSAWAENTQVRCRPCGSHGPKVCPLGSHFCMTSLTPEFIWKSFVDKLQSP